MKLKAKMIFPAALGVLCLALSSAQAATANDSTNLASASSNAGANLNATMDKLFGDPVIAKGKGFQIKQSDLDEVMAGIKAAAAERNQTIPQHQLKMIETEMLNRLIAVQLLLQKANAADRVEGKKLADLQMKALLERAGSEKTLERQFSALGMSTSQLRKRMEQEATAQAALVRELKITVTDAETKKFYDEHPEDFELPQRVRIDQIFLSTRNPLTGAALSDADKAAKKKEAEDILKRARAGEDFEKLAKQYSDDPAVQQNGGEYTIARGQTPPEFEAAAFSLNTNQVSDVLTTASGYHIIKLLEKLPAKKLDYATVADRLKKALIQQEATKQSSPYVAKLEKQDDVQILDPDLKAMEQELKAKMDTNAPVVPMTPAPNGKKK